MRFSIRDFAWTRKPESCVITQDAVEVVIKPHKRTCTYARQLGSAMNVARL